MGETGLALKKCVPCRGGIPPLSVQKAQEFLKKIDNWGLVGGGKKIRKNFEFKNFLESMGFVNRVAKVAEMEGHHPDIFVSYNKVTLTVFTHAIGGLHENDFILAAKIDAIKKTGEKN